jgi:23S rRNA (cytidine2498-2'-O)-methyltransferase
VAASASYDFVIAARRLARTFGSVLLTCQAGYETLLARELAELQGVVAAETGPGWVRVADPTDAPEGGLAPADDGGRSPVRSSPAFAHLTLQAPREIRGGSVNALAAGVAGFFFDSVRGERIESAWPSIWGGPPELVGLGRRISAVEDAFGELLKKKVSRVAKLARTELPRGVGLARGLFVYFADFDRLFVSRTAFNHGAQRMADDELAPSRSYLKVEEAYLVLGREPHAGEIVCDLGAAPGGWSYSAAKRGAHVVAVDNGPLKGGALDHPRIEHRREDAFGFTPAATSFDWLFCDLVDEPHHVLRHLIEPWLARGWCQKFVVNLKFGRVDPIALLRELRAPESPFARHVSDFHIRHLYHDREEFTVVGRVSR